MVSPPWLAGIVDTRETCRDRLDRMMLAFHQSCFSAANHVKFEVHISTLCSEEGFRAASTEAVVTNSEQFTQHLSPVCHIPGSLLVSGILCEGHSYKAGREQRNPQAAKETLPAL
jgi:hypothetical protein